MKNLVKALFVFAVSAFVLTSCNKEKAAVKKLDGSWEVKSTSASVESVDCSTGGGSTDVTTTTWNFEAYTVGDEETGTVIMTSTTAGVSSSDTMDYAVNEDADMLTLSASFSGLTISLPYTINKLSKSELEVELTTTEDILTECPDSTNSYLGVYDEDVSVTTTMTLEKQ